MKKLIALLALCCVIQSPAQVISVEFLEHFEVSDIQDVMDDFGLPPALIPINHEVDYYAVEYMTLHPNGDSVLVSGGMALPSGVECPIPLVCYMHGTIAERIDVPSMQSDEGYLGVLYATSGYASILPDLIGLGSSELLHLYVHAESEAQAGVDMISAAHDLQDELNFNLDNQHFIYGYSQGGHAAMALAKKMEEEYSDVFPLTASAPMSGPYDISGAQASVITADIPYPTPGYLPYVVLSYNEVYGTIYGELTEIFVPPYDSLIGVLFDGEHSMSYINNLMPDIPNQVLVPEVLEAYENEPDHPIRLALEDNDLVDWAPQAPMKLFYCIGDDQVSYLNSIHAYDQFVVNGAPFIEEYDIGNYDHSDCASFAMLGGYYYFGDHYVPYFDVEVEFDVQDVMEGTGDSGSITVTIVDDPGYNLEWSTGDTGETIDNLPPGDYTLTVSNDEGCSETYEIEIGFIVGVENEQTEELKIYPNPAEDILSISGINSRQSLSIFNLQADLIWQSTSSGQSIELDVSNWPPGTYLLRIDGHRTEVRQIVIR